MPLSDREDYRAMLAAVLEAPADDVPRLLMADFLDESAGHTKGPCDKCADGFRRHANQYRPSHVTGMCRRCGGSRTIDVPDGAADRAEFIRVQCEIARTENYPGERFCAAANGLLDRRAKDCRKCEPCRLRRRQRELLKSRQPDDSVGGNSANTFAAARYVWAGPVARLDDPDQSGWTFRRGFVQRVACSWELFARHGRDIAAATPLAEVELTSWPGWVAVPSTENRGYTLDRLAAEFVAGITFRLPRLHVFDLRYGTASTAGP